MERYIGLTHREHIRRRLVNHLNDLKKTSESLVDGNDAWAAFRESLNLCGASVELSAGLIEALEEGMQPFRLEVKPTATGRAEQAVHVYKPTEWLLGYLAAARALQGHLEDVA